MKLILTTTLALACLIGQATNLKISQPVLYIQDDAAFAVFNLNWDNAWHNDRNHDAIWVFFKSLNQDGYRHIQVLNEGHSVVASFGDSKPSISFESPKDNVGLFVYPNKNFRGNISLTLKVMLNKTSFEGVNARNSLLKAYGVEMVSIPQGSFSLGDTDKDTHKYGTFYNPKDPTKYIQLKSENQELEVSANGDLYYDTPEGYEGDQSGPISKTYPKGVNAFYMMKYELTEGEYCAFLNSLNANQVVNRLNHKHSDYYKKGGSITFENDRYTSPYPNKPCTFMSWDDAMVYADWAGLRPMTEFEYTKACRGSDPNNSAFPWNTNSKDQIQRLPNKHGVLEMRNGWDESQLTDENKSYFGASYYWVMDLSGSMWERVITIGHQKGRSFSGTHGDGEISTDGSATNQEWPIGEEDTGGIGFRGGGFYGYDRNYHEYNPFSPITYRPYGGWHGGMRTKAYGTRFVRTK